MMACQSRLAVGIDPDLHVAGDSIWTALRFVFAGFEAKAKLSSSFGRVTFSRVPERK
jgi:hypothetical protein